MSQNEIEILKAGAPDLKRQQDEQERKIRSEVATEFPDMSPEGRESVVQSRLNILNNPGRPKLIQVDLGENASKKVKDKLFE